MSRIESMRGNSKESKMRKAILIGLMAATMIPSAATAREHGSRHEAREDSRHRNHNQKQVRRHNRGWTAYAAPVRNWRYRPVTVGYTLQPAFFGQRYFVSNYNTYQLRAPGRHQRWVRYGDDLLLVNVRNGRVLQVIHNRYW
jgi:Ni/Co efflux regulator RcnB